MAGRVRVRGALQVRPCKLGRRIHAAHAPAPGPTPPSTDSRDLSLIHTMRGCSSFDCRNIRFVWRIIHAWRGSTRHEKSVRGGAVSECGVSAAWMRLPSLHGRTCGVPALRHRPATTRKSHFGCCCCRCLNVSAGAGPQALPPNPITWQQRSAFRCRRPSPGRGRCAPACPVDPAGASAAGRAAWRNRPADRTGPRSRSDR